MKVLRLLLGHFATTHKPFFLYRIPETSTFLFNLGDISTHFNLLDLHRHPYLKEHYKSKDKLSYRDAENIYVSGDALVHVAVECKQYLLAELCKLKPNEYKTGPADTIISRLPNFTPIVKEERIYKSVEIGWQPMTPSGSLTKVPINTPPALVLPEGNGTASKSQSSSPPKVHVSSAETSVTSQETNESFVRASNQTNNRRLYSATRNDDEHLNKRPRLNGNDFQADEPRSQHILPKPVHTVSSQIHTPTSNSPLLAKRASLKQNKNSRNLTIYAPSYNEQISMSVRSAPLNSNFHQRSQQYQQQHQGPPPATAAQPREVHPPHTSYYLPSVPRSGASLYPGHRLAPLLSPRVQPGQSPLLKQEFAIPPVVPSQQAPMSAHPQPPNSGNPYQQYASSPSVYKNHPTRGEGSHGSTYPATAAAVPLPPQTPTTSSHAALQRQQFLQPFDHLFDTIETTRTLKSTLDDQIRRSSTLIQTLQASVTTVEGLVRNQVNEIRKEMMGDMETSLNNIVKRIGILEGTMNNGQQQQENSHSPQINVTNTSASRNLKSPPAIVRSQNDIGPQECQNMLSTLLERLDRLERQLES
ncbi:hypothetical protein DFQ28_011228 [Apophysomyces sp. BC1034]|nr:hypothetical protein DFQ30_005430 [Apophysomyces sp. BC1015]KAG0177813.1 hypothetical protein DFQ29_004299 [Apophysomyces sp. BC1021]KAG0194427.1 hypothetical protein DFQ28_011228 [Apophysomyces sp. BC1034]